MHGRRCRRGCDSCSCKAGRAAALGPAEPGRQRCLPTGQKRRSGPCAAPTRKWWQPGPWPLGAMAVARWRWASSAAPAASVRDLQHQLLLPLLPGPPAAGQAQGQRALQGCVHELSGGVARLCALGRHEVRVCISTGASTRGVIVEKSDFTWYGSANLWKLMAAKELAECLHGTGVEVFAVQPGMSRTDFFSKMDYSQTDSTTHNKMQQLGGQPASRGAISALFAATEPSLAGEGRSGAYFGPYYFRLPNWFSAHFPFTFNMGQTMELQPANSLARDPDARRRLYEAAADALEESLHAPLPARLPPPAHAGAAADMAATATGAGEGQTTVL
ncbi:hypothetical protein ABPG75_003135 [Micractinium tetrahymenae]